MFAIDVTALSQLSEVRSWSHASLRELSVTLLKPLRRQVFLPWIGSSGASSYGRAQAMNML